MSNAINVIIEKEGKNYVSVKERVESFTKESQLILDYWNSKEIMIHKNIKPDRVNVLVKKILKNYSIDEIFISIDNYAQVIKDDAYYYCYKYSLNSFISGKTPYLHFMTDGERWINYIEFKKKSNTPKVEPIVYVHKGSYDEGLYQKSINMLKNIPYNEYLFSSHWKHFTQETLKWANYKCQLCNNGKILLHVHHKSYENRGRETFNDVIVLCSDCHKLIHDKTKNKSDFDFASETL